MGDLEPDARNIDYLKSRTAVPRLDFLPFQLHLMPGKYFPTKNVHYLTEILMITSHIG